MRIIFMGTPEFSVPVLDALVAAGHDIAAVYTQPPRPAGRGKRTDRRRCICARWYWGCLSATLCRCATRRRRQSLPH